MEQEGDAQAGAGSESCCYAAVIENRAREVGVAVADLGQLRLHLSQFIEPGRSYTTTQLLLDAFAPRQLVVVGSSHHEVSGAAGLNAVTAAAWPQARLPRAAFDDTRGILAVQELTGWGAAADDAAGGGSGEAMLRHKSHYLAFGAAGAVLAHMRALGLAVAPHVMQVQFDGVKHHMALDRDSISSLEILAPTRTASALQNAVVANSSSAAAIMQQQAAAAGERRPGADASQPAEAAAGGGRRGSRWRCWQQAPAASSNNSRSGSLYGFLNYTVTACGARLLRTNLLQPLTDIPTLQLRLDSLQELLESPHLTLELMSLMEALPKNLDKVCSNLAVRPAAASGRDPSAQLGQLVSSVVLLRDVLRCLPVLVDSMAWVDSQLLQAIRGNLGHEQLQQLLKDVEAVLDDDAQASKTAFVNTVQQCFAVRAQVDSFLDLSRATFSRLTESIHDLAGRYRSSTGTPGLKVQYSSGRGFFIVVPEQQQGQPARAGSGAAGGGGARAAQGGGGGSTASGQLPRSFLVLEKRGRSSLCVTTHELNALNSRLRDAAADCMLLTVQVLDRLVAKLLQHMPLLQRLLDNIALLDVLLSFFQAVTGAEGDFCRPLLQAAGPLAITRGRHPLLLAALRGRPQGCQANDAYVSPSCSLQLLTGPNMSGKSTYLKQVALLVVMAQLGCYVPAAFMAITPYERLHTRIGTGDSIEANASSFMVEMADMARVLARAGPRSLVLIDELGRATSTADGVALCWAMAEYLLALSAHVLLATHFRQLEELAATYPTCKLWRMQVDVSSGDIAYSWRIAAAAASDGADSGADASAAARHYGITLARAAGLPAHITERALQVAQQLEEEQRQAQAAAAAAQQMHGGGDGAAEAAEGGGGGLPPACLRKAYSLVHKLGCVARQAVSEGLPEPAAAAGAAAGAAADASSASAEARAAAAAAVRNCMPLVAALKREAEALLLAAASAGSDAAAVR